ncbi:hypothetical protein INR49_028142 [Caranx melampygus]|nr:hypothetical protein INR49_028142 [Caranx melampygus]
MLLLEGSAPQPNWFGRADDTTNHDVAPVTDARRKEFISEVLTRFVFPFSFRLEEEKASPPPRSCSIQSLWVLLLSFRRTVRWSPRPCSHRASSLLWYQRAKRIQTEKKVFIFVPDCTEASIAVEKTYYCSCCFLVVTLRASVFLPWFRKDISASNTTMSGKRFELVKELVAAPSRRQNVSIFREVDLSDKYDSASTEILFKKKKRKAEHLHKSHIKSLFSLMFLCFIARLSPFNHI